MKENINKFLETIFSIFLIIAILGGGIIFLMFIGALIIGGGTGEVLATKASKEIMPYFIRSASIAITAGLLSFYISGDHTLSLKEEK